MKDKVITVNFSMPDYKVHVVCTDNPFVYRNETLIKKYPYLGSFISNFTALFTHDHNYYPSESWIIVSSEAKVYDVTHEAIHAIDAMMDHFGFEGTEFRAYGVQHILKQIYK